VETGEHQVYERDLGMLDDVRILLNITGLKEDRTRGELEPGCTPWMFDVTFADGTHYRYETFDRDFQSGYSIEFHGFAQNCIEGKSEGQTHYIYLLIKLIIMKRLFLFLAALFIVGAAAYAQNTDQVVESVWQQSECEGSVSIRSRWYPCLRIKGQDYKFGLTPEFRLTSVTISVPRSGPTRSAQAPASAAPVFAVKTQITPDWYGEVDMELANGSFELKDCSRPLHRTGKLAVQRR
jgi:hypothetical protein